MSGPTTAIFVADPITVMLAGSAIRAAQAIAEGYDHAANLREEQQDHRDRLHGDLKQAASSGRAALLQEVAAAQTEFDEIASLAQRYVAIDKIAATKPAQPDNELQLAAYVRAMRALINELRALLLTESARRMDDLGVEATLEIAIAQAAPAEPASMTAVRRLLARIAHLGAPPQEITNIANEIEHATNTERMQLLIIELRMRIQKYIETVQSQAVQQASALILQQSLKELGYRVEDVASTLFVEGGMVHFQRQEWGNYLVRMRVDPKTATTNFNVVRAVDEANNERSVLDHLAEDRWCAEFPALLQALDVRGLHLNVTRRLGAGELPVQLVKKDQLPRFIEEEKMEHTQKLQSRELK